MTESLTLPAALLMGLAASGHCLLMCGGIASASGVVAMPGESRRPPLSWLLASQLGRVASYGLAGLLAGGVLGGVVDLLDSEAVRTALRLLSAVALAIAAAVVAGLLRDPGQGIGRLVWQRVAPLARRLLPLRSSPAAFAFGMVWGWMPCGFVYSVLLVAALAADPGRSAATMVLFGLGTLPAMLAMSLGASRLPRLAPGGRVRQVAGGLLLICALATAIAPWLPLHGATHEPDLHPAAAVGPDGAPAVRAPSADHGESGHRGPGHRGSSAGGHHH